jgi:hypothetical protein
VNRPRQHTTVLMLPIDLLRAEEIARRISDSTQPAEEFAALTLELLCGIASIESHADRQSTALAAAVAIFQSTLACETALAGYMAELYEQLSH